MLLRFGLCWRDCFGWCVWRVCLCVCARSSVRPFVHPFVVVGGGGCWVVGFWLIVDLLVGRSVGRLVGC